MIIFEIIFVSRYRDVFLSERYIGVIQKKKLEKSGLGCFLLTESLKIGVLVKKKLKKSLEIEKIGF